MTDEVFDEVFTKEGRGMATFVIVHGAWGGGWAWRKTVAPLLREAGHEVLTPTLTGLGERVHLAGPDVDLDTHIQDVVNTLIWEDLHDVVLVGHSYGGMVITGVADRAGDRLRHLVYLDAMVPAEGQSLADLVDLDGQARQEMAARAVDGWRLQPGPVSPDLSPGMRAWAEPRRAAQPLKTFTQPFALTGGQGKDLPRVYVLCTAPAGDAFARIAARLRDDPTWRVEEFATGHNLHYTMAREVTELLVGVVSRES